MREASPVATFLSGCTPPEILGSDEPPKGENSPACVPDTRAPESSEVIILEEKK